MTRPIVRRNYEPPRSGHRLTRPGRQVTEAGASLALYENVTAPEYDTTYYEYKATAKPVYLSDGVYELYTGATAQTVWFPLVPRRDLLSGVTSDQAAKTRLVAYIGERVYVAVRGDGDLEAVTPPLTRWRGELKDNHDPGDTSTCYLHYHTGAAYATDTTIEFEALDVFSRFYGRKQGKFSSPHDDGSYVLAQYMPDSNTFGMEWMTPHALKIQGQLTANLAGATATFTIDNVEVMQPTGAILVNTDPAGNVTVNNMFADTGLNNAIAVANWNADDTDWDAERVKETRALMVNALVNEAGGVDTTDSTFDVDNVEVMGPLNAVSPGSSLSGVRNIHSVEFDNNAPVQLRYNVTDDKWDTTQGDCPA